MNSDELVSESSILKAVQNVLMDAKVKSATAYQSPQLVVTATRRCKSDARACRIEMVLTIGKPNYRGRAFVKACLKAGEPFPVKKVQLRWMPK